MDGISVKKKSYCIIFSCIYSHSFKEVKILKIEIRSFMLSATSRLKPLSLWAISLLYASQSGKVWEGGEGNFYNFS